nr:hypothetical protein [bacterium]
VLDNGFFRYEIAQDGKNLHFIDCASGRDYLDQQKVSRCALIQQKGKPFPVSALRLKGDRLYLEFDDARVRAEILLQNYKDRWVYRVDKVAGEVEALTFLNIPLTLEGMPYEPFAACVLSMNLFTHVRQLPALQTHLWATCYARFGLKGAEATLLAIPQERILPAIREVMSRAPGVPFSDKGGAWALMQKEGYGSYLMNFGTLNEENVDEWIRMCTSLGFNQIDNHGGGDFFKFGDFELNPKKWPDGWPSFKRINARLHEAGISSLFHTYAFFVDKNSKYVTPVPSADLDAFRRFTLAKSVGENDTVLVVHESTASISTITGFFVRNSVTLRIGQELITFSRISDAPPYRFMGCKRGALGTRISAHQAGEAVFHLKEAIDRFVPGPDTPLFDEIAARTAEIVNECDFDGIYLDAIDLSDLLGGEEYFWYYGTKFIFTIAKKLRRPVGMEMSSMSHHWWHYRSRWQAWDRPVRGYKRFVDIHSAAIKSTRLFHSEKIKANENEHGLWRGHAPLIDRYALAENGGLLLPLHLGWWGNQTWNPPQVEPTFPDDVEYLCCKMIGNHAGVSMLGGVDEKTLEATPLFRRLAAIIRQYEELRHANYFSESVRALLRQPGKEFTLIRQEDGRWNLKPVSYHKHKVEGLSHPSAHWSSPNQFGEQPIKLRMEVLMAMKSYADPSPVVLADFSQPEGFVIAGKAAGVSGEIGPSFERPADGTPAARFSAAVAPTVPQEGLWIKWEKKFAPCLDLSKHQALGVWVKGDASGQLLNFRLESPKYLSHGARGDHFIKIDFSGWRYFELVEIESSAFSDYIWPDSGFYVYDSYRHTVHFDRIDKLQIWFNNLAAGKTSSCLISAVKALPLMSATIENPSITAAGRKVTFKTKMASGMVLEFYSAEDCKLYGPKGEFLQDVKIEGDIPFLQAGENLLSFDCQGSDSVNTRVQVTVIHEGRPLDR